MKKILLVLSLLILTNFAQAQWYFKEYKVNDINLLTKLQLDESLKLSRSNMWGGGLCVVLGGGLLLANKYGLWESDTNPSDFEKLIGRKSLHDIYGAIGIAFIAGGTIGFFGYLDRSKNIKVAMRRNFPALGSLHLLPKIDYNQFTSSANLGLNLTFNF